MLQGYNYTIHAIGGMVLTAHNQIKHVRYPGKMGGIFLLDTRVDWRVQITWCIFFISYSFTSVVGMEYVSFVFFYFLFWYGTLSLRQSDDQLNCLLFRIRSI